MNNEWPIRKKKLVAVDQVVKPQAPAKNKLKIAFQNQKLLLVVRFDYPNIRVIQSVSQNALLIRMQKLAAVGH